MVFAFRELYAPETQSINNETYVFMNWTDGDSSSQRTVKLTTCREVLTAVYCHVLDCPGKNFFNLFAK